MPIPVPAPDVQNVVDGAYSLPDALFSDILRFAFPNGPTTEPPAPPCKQQAPFTIQGETSQYPHLKPALRLT